LQHLIEGCAYPLQILRLVLSVALSGAQLAVAKHAGDLAHGDTGPGKEGGGRSSQDVGAKGLQPRAASRGGKSCLHRFHRPALILDHVAGLALLDGVAEIRPDAVGNRHDCPPLIRDGESWRVEINAPGDQIHLLTTQIQQCPTALQGKECELDEEPDVRLITRLNQTLAFGRGQHPVLGPRGGEKLDRREVIDPPALPSKAEGGPYHLEILVDRRIGALSPLPAPFSPAPGDVVVLGNQVELIDVAEMAGSGEGQHPLVNAAGIGVAGAVFDVTGVEGAGHFKLKPIGLLHSAAVMPPGENDERLLGGLEIGRPR